MFTLTLPMSPETATAFLKSKNPGMLEKLNQVGYPHIGEMFRNFSHEEHQRISQGRLTPAERADTDGITLTQHAACIIAASMAPCA